jgi:hypothetical protein
MEKQQNIILENNIEILIEQIDNKYNIQISKLENKIIELENKIIELENTSVVTIYPDSIVPKKINRMSLNFGTYNIIPVLWIDLYYQNSMWSNFFWISYSNTTDHQWLFDVKNKFGELKITNIDHVVYNLEPTESERKVVEDFYNYIVSKNK